MVFNYKFLPRLQTDRLVLSEITMADQDAVFELFSSPEVTEYNDVVTMRAHQEAQSLINFVQDRFDRKVGLRWGIRYASDESHLIGTCGYNWWTQHNNCAEIGYDLIPKLWGQGIMTEALNAMIRFGFNRMNLNRIEADVVPGNDASVRVLCKLGFQEEGLLRQRGYWKGQYHDLRFFSLLRSDFDA